MNDDQIKGKAKDIGGKIQEKVGEVTGNRQTQKEGNLNQAEGKVQEKVGDVKDIFKGNK
ncbi:CsbD family protein [Massilia niabensis]|uniref:CsbD family protein n=1 Tax=Massilia niabensis TaxID=544910 RepID=A0ABW0L9C3_9BURK